MQEKIEVSIPTAEKFVQNMTDIEMKDIKTEFVGRIVTIIIAGLGLISVLAWDDALKDLYRSIVADSSSLNGKFGYAIVITLFGVIVSIILGRAFLRKKKKNLLK